MQATEQTITSKPSGPGDWSISRIVEALSRPLPANMLSQRKQGGQTLDYIPWYRVNKILDKYSPGWQFEITKMEVSESHVFLVGRLTIPALDGITWREATGMESLKELDKRTGELRDIAYGNAVNNCESSVFRRCAARFGLGLNLYEK